MIHFLSPSLFFSLSLLSCCFSIDFQMSPITSSLILNFSEHSERKSARLLHTFPRMNAVTICSQVLFEPRCHGLSTVFSYSIRSFANEFQLQALVPPLKEGGPIKFTLTVHGNMFSSEVELRNDRTWHSLCVSWRSARGIWEIWMDGQLFDKGEGLYPGEDLGGNGIFIVGQGQEGDGNGKRFRAGESFCGSVTQLHIWDRALRDSEILTMEKVCSPISPGLDYNWSAAALEIEPSLTNYWGNSPCQGKKKGWRQGEWREEKSFRVDPLDYSIVLLAKASLGCTAQSGFQLLL